MFFLQT